MEPTQPRPLEAFESIGIRILEVSEGGSEARQTITAARDSRWSVL